MSNNFSIHVNYSAKFSKISSILHSTGNRGHDTFKEPVIPESQFQSQNESNPWKFSVVFVDIGDPIFC